MTSPEPSKGAGPSDTETHAQTHAPRKPALDSAIRGESHQSPRSSRSPSNDGTQSRAVEDSPLERFFHGLTEPRTLRRLRQLRRAKRPPPRYEPRHAAPADPDTRGVE